MIAPSIALLLHALLIAFVPASAEAARTPKTLAQIPIYPGAVPAPADEEAPEEGQNPAGRRVSGVRTPNDVGPTVREYHVKTGIDDVVEFYRQRLGGREGSATELNDFYDKLKPRESSPVLLDVALVNFDELAGSLDEGGHERTPLPQIAARLKSIYVKSRTPYRPGQWVSWAAFAWLRRNAAGTFTSFSLNIEDLGVLDYDAGALPNETGIAMTVEEESQAAETETETREKPPLPEPSAAALGVPKYPGAAYDPRISGGMSSEEAEYFIYTTADPPEKVTTFYERQTGKQAMKTEGGALIAVKGTGLFPELGVTIQPNAGTYPAAVKTMITVRRGRSGR